MLTVERDEEQEARALAAGRRKGRSRPRYYLRVLLADFAAVLGVSKRQVQRWVKLGRFNPKDFASVAALLRSRQPKEK